MTHRGFSTFCAVTAILVLAGSAPSALAQQPRYPIHPGQPMPPPKPEPDGPTIRERASIVRDKAGEIMTQPIRDVGVAKIVVPPVLDRDPASTYSLQGLRTCPQLVAAVEDLNEVLGPDFAPGYGQNESRAGKLAEAGGRAVVNSLLPFRGIVREISGAAPAERRLAGAVDAGLARRGFLRGVISARGCRT